METMMSPYCNAAINAPYTNAGEAIHHISAGVIANIAFLGIGIYAVASWVASGISTLRHKFAEAFGFE